MDLKKNRGAIAFILIILIAVFTNPDEDKHREGVKSKLNTYMQKSVVKTDNEWEQAGQTLGLALGGMIIEELINSSISTDNYILFSMTKITWDGESKIIGAGAFGNVFLTKKIDEILDQALKEK
jgi:hypothetical protein